MILSFAASCFYSKDESLSLIKFNFVVIGSGKNMLTKPITTPTTAKADPKFFKKLRVFATDEVASINLSAASPTAIKVL